MPVEEEVLRLRSEVTGVSEAKALEDQLARNAARAEALQAELDGLRDAYQRNAVTGADFASEQRRIEAEIGKVEAATRRLERTQGGAADKAGSANKRTTQSFVELGRVFQDVAQGGIASAANNFEGLSRATSHLGQTAMANPASLLAGWPGIVAALGTAALVAAPQIIAFFQGMERGDGINFAAIETGVGRVEAALKDVGEQLDELRKKQKLTMDEAARFNVLRAEQERLQDDRKAEQEKKDLAERSRTEDRPEEERARQRQGLFEETLPRPADREALVESVRKAMPQTEIEQKKAAAGEAAKELAALQAEKAALDEAGRVGGIDETRYDERVDEINRKMEEQKRIVNEAAQARKRFEVTAADLVNRATLQGDEAARQQILRLQRQRPDAFTDFQRFAVANADVDARRREEKVIEGQRRRHQEDLKDRDATIKLLKEEGPGPAAPGPEKAPQGRVEPVNDAAKVQAEQNRAQVGRQLKAEQQSAESHGYNARALAALQAGADRGMSRNAAIDAAIAMTTRDLRARNRGMSAETAREQAVPIVMGQANALAANPALGPRAQHEAAVQGLAGAVGRGNPGLLTEAQARAVAEKALQLREGMGPIGDTVQGAQQALNAALRDVLGGISNVQLRVSGLEQWAKSFAGGARQLRQQMTPGQPSALNFGGPF